METNKKASVEIGVEKAIQLLNLVEANKIQEGNRALLTDLSGRKILVDGDTGLVTVMREGKHKVQIKSWDKQETFVAFGLSSNGYTFTDVNLNGEDKKVAIHTLMFAMLRTDEFRAGIESGNVYVVNHMNGCRVDNHIQNLEYVTRAENILHGAALTALRLEYPYLFTEVTTCGVKGFNYITTKVLKDSYISAKDCEGLTKVIADKTIEFLEDSKVIYSGRN